MIPPSNYTDARATPSWVDIGVNLSHRSFASDLPAVLERAQHAGVHTLIVTGTSLETTRRAIELASEHRGLLYATAGIHPHDAKDYDAEADVALRELANRPEVVAVGECGLDFNRNYSPPSAQRQALEAQLELAAEVGLPVFLHERDATDDLVDIVGRYRERLVDAVVHCFTGDGEALAAYLDLDLHVGITGWICDERRGSHLIELVPRIPAGRLMLETDAPFLLPRTIKPKPKSRRNEPAYLNEVAEVVARARNTTVGALARETTATARRFFRISGSD